MVSWETLVVGEVEFKENINKKLENKIKKALENVLETKLEWNDDYKNYQFQDVNWLSHVEGKKIKAVVEKFRKYIKYFSCSVFYLNESDEDIIFDGKEVKARVFW